MGRNAEIDGIIEAWWKLDHCLPPEKAQSLSALNQLLDATVAKSQGRCNRDQILDWLWPRYREYRMKIHREGQVKIVQTSLGKSN